MRLHRAPKAAALLLAATVALSACSDDDPDSPEPSPTPSSTSASPTATPSAKPTEPVLPEAAKKATEAGARAFITYYWDLINYAQVTGDVKALKKASGSNCNGCRAGIRAVQSHYESGGHIEGGDYAIDVLAINELKSHSTPVRAFEAKLAVENAPQTVIDGDGSERRESAGESSAIVATFWSSGRWRLGAMEIR